MRVYKKYIFKNKFLIQVSENKKVYANSQVTHGDLIKTDFYNENKNYNKIKDKYKKKKGKKLFLMKIKKFQNYLIHI